MSNQGGKLSFGFSKVIKKPNLLKNNSENETSVKNVQLIDSIEGSELKIHGKNPDEDKQKDLVIPLTDEQKSRPISKLIESRRKRNRTKSVTDGEEKNKDLTETNGTAETKAIDKDETLEERAAREILEDLKNKEDIHESKILELPVHPDELPLDGATESTIDDYERIPIADFGKAMLRGMGWKEEKKDEKDDPNKFEMFVRPKGLGLGADKVVKKQKLLVNPAPNETLEIKKNACVKILAGKHKNLYGTIEGFDDGGGRLIIKLAIGGLKVQMNEFMVQPVPKQEFAKYSKILNSEKYEEYKNDEGKSSAAKEVVVKHERKSRSKSPATSKRRDKSKSPSTSRSNRERQRSRSNERDRSKSHRDRSRERRSRERSPHHSRRNYSPDSEDDKTYNRKYNERRRSRSHDRHRRRHSSSDSSSERYSSKKKSSKKSSKSKSKRHSSDDEKVHKKKYKRSKHDRDRRS